MLGSSGSVMTNEEMIEAAMAAFRERLRKKAQVDKENAEREAAEKAAARWIDKEIAELTASRKKRATEANSISTSTSGSVMPNKPFTEDAEKAKQPTQKKAKKEVGLSQTSSLSNVVIGLTEQVRKMFNKNILKDSIGDYDENLNYPPQIQNLVNMANRTTTVKDSDKCYVDIQH